MQHPRAPVPSHSCALPQEQSEGKRLPIIRGGLSRLAFQFSASHVDLFVEGVLFDSLDWSADASFNESQGMPLPSISRPLWPAYFAWLLPICFLTSS